ncbi:Hint domain-containing protein [Tabrizicola sp.]|uniref:Hint domain-containing protein n=1 Tax=Tabrizicola sp. TaxID=2005166 RepID=UPI001A5FCED1|nr:Hint domain-containing protein [Tabrizicola sp.]MBL9074654.1 Hint domain-containing protein [Tabrizicola sp.]
MVAERITVGVYALDRVILPKPAGAKGWAARLAEALPVLTDGAVPVPIHLSEGPEGLVLTEDAPLGLEHPAGSAVAVEPVAGRPGFFLLRIGGKAAGLSSALPWNPGSEPSLHGVTLPEALAGFAAGTLIDTPDGPRAVETLVAGEVVTTLGNGSRPLRWVGRRRVEAVEMLAHPGLRPVAFEPGILGNARDLLVSPQQRLLIDDWRAAVYFGEDRVLVAAQALVDDQAARVMLPAGGIDYVMLLCDRHEVLLAEGALSESFHPGETGLAALLPEDRARLTAVCPEPDLLRRRAAFPIVRNAEARALRLHP